MSRSEVRAQVVAYLTSLDLPHVGKVFRAAPKVTPESEFFMNDKDFTLPNRGTGALLFVNIERQREYLDSFPAVDGGKKYRNYHIFLYTVLRSFKPDAQVATDDNDALLEAICVGIESDPHLGDASIIFQAGLGAAPNFGPDIEWETEPVKQMNGQMVQIFSRGRFTAIEVIQPTSN